MYKPQFIYIHESHLDLFWLGDYNTCLSRGDHVIKQYIERCIEHEDEAFLLETVVFLKHFLDTYPNYKEIIKKLWDRGQLDIGCAYVDIWQNLVLGESHINNVIEGRAWCKKQLGINTVLAVHPDLPGMVPQISQIYSKAGISFYATARKIFPDGAVWEYMAPDGSKLMVLNHPCHYDFHPLSKDPILTDVNEGWNRYIDPDRTLKGFPLGKVVLSAGAGDLADMDFFVQRFGCSAREFVESYRQQYPNIDFSFGTISSVLHQYQNIVDQLPVAKGEIPSVWGVAADESVAFFNAARKLEGKLLTAGALAAVGLWYGFKPISSVRQDWYGIFYQDAYFKDKDLIDRGDELPSLWRMHIFTQDHNGGGKEGVLSEFQKRTIQDRAIKYADEIINHNMKCIAEKLSQGRRILLFNPLNKQRKEPVEVDIPQQWLQEYIKVPYQIVGFPDKGDHTVRIAVAGKARGMGYATLDEPSGETTCSKAVVRDDGYKIMVDSEAMTLAVDKRTGALCSFIDNRTGVDWGNCHINSIYALHEYGNDVSLRVDESNFAGMETVDSVELADVGPLFIKIRINKRVLKADVVQEIILWQQGINMLDVNTSILWHGQHDLQLRQYLPTAMKKDDIIYGTPFYGNRWDNIVEGSGPRNGDEISMEDWQSYREVQLWLHQRRGKSALAIATLHPAFHWGKEGLEAVLMRTVSSCGDNRFYWENSGHLEYKFRFKFGYAADGIGWAFDLGQATMCPMIPYVADNTDGDKASLPLQNILIGLDYTNILLSSVYPEVDGNIVIRFFETEGRCTTILLNMPKIRKLQRITLEGDIIEELHTDNSGWRMQIQPYEIVTLRAVI